MPERCPSQSVPGTLEEGFLFDCCELFKGNGNWSDIHAQRGLICHGGFDAHGHGHTLSCSDLSSMSTFREVIALVLRRVVRDWHAKVPCLSFGSFQKPKIRSRGNPSGANSCDALTAHHNMLARRIAFVLNIAVLLGQYVSAEQPADSCMFQLHCYKVLIRLGCVISHVALCSYGSAFHQHLLWLHNKPWLIPLESSCQCPLKKKHFEIRGSFNHERKEIFNNQCRPSCVAVYGFEPLLGQAVSSFAANYPQRLLHRMASGLQGAKQGLVERIPLHIQHRSLCEVGLEECEPGILPCTEENFPARPWHEDLEWIHELCESLNFKELFRFKFKASGHINANETRTYKSWIKAMAKAEPDSRFVGLLDSRVTIGASAKGRSSSFAISRVLQGCIAYVIGGGLYPGCLHCYSEDNRGDAPSRGRPVVGPSIDKPVWLEDLLSGDPHRFDCVVASTRFSKNPARWLRFLLLLCGDVEPNPGPLHRGKLDLNVGFSAATASRMRKCVHAFGHWCLHELNVSLDMLSADPASLVLALRAYGIYCFESGLPRYIFVFAIIGIQNLYPFSKPLMGPAWQIDRKRQIHEPGSCRAVLHALVIRAAVCLAALWGWKSWAGIVLLGFSAMLHPSEMLALTRQDLVFPRDLCFDSLSLFLKLQNPKTSRFARRQHGRVDNVCIIQIAESLFYSLPMNNKLYPGSMSAFRRQWDAIMAHLGIPHRQTDSGATPGVLRGSGATYLYSCSEDVQWIAWRGRWARLKTLEYYRQEVAAYVLIHSLSPVAKARIEVFSKFSWPVLQRTLCLQRSTEGMDENQ